MMSHSLSEKQNMNLLTVLTTGWSAPVCFFGKETQLNAYTENKYEQGRMASFLK